ncbi:chemotaxis protein CheB [Pseudoduganella sp. GCM10020061]|uniref:chemotaxis protein CheB n=1 Tax=Pseudoduganella sp. GCM10020061 TaxID=3317345 RepID=UPI0036254458
MGLPKTNRTSLIAIGASAGGIEAVSTLLRALPAAFDIPVVVVVHLPPNRPSLLPELFARHCALPVREAQDKEPLQAGTVYVAAPDYHLMIEPGGMLSLSCDAPVLFSRPSLDMLFESAALAYQESLLAIVLTGASADGAEGLATVRRLGGTGWVQEPEEAQASIMPLAAIKKAGADQVLRLHDMAGLLPGLMGREE